MNCARTDAIAIHRSTSFFSDRFGCGCARGKSVNDLARSVYAHLWLEMARRYGVGAAGGRAGSWCMHGIGIDYLAAVSAMQQRSLAGALVA